MKRLLLVLTTLCLCHCLYAQSSLTYRGGKFYGNDGRVLSDANMLNLVGRDVYYDTYVDARRQLRLGKTLAFTGIGVFSAGLAATIVGAYTGYDAIYYSGAAVSVVGGALIDAGIPIWVIGSSRLHWIESDYNKKHASVQVQLSLVVVNGGIGLSARF
jgi:hypothetical protein